VSTVVKIGWTNGGKADNKVAKCVVGWPRAVKAKFMLDRALDDRRDGGEKLPPKE